MLEIKNLVQINLSFLDLVSLFLHTSDWAMCAVSRVNSSTHSPTFHIIFAPPYGRQAVSRLVALPHLSGQKVQKKRHPHPPVLECNDLNIPDNFLKKSPIYCLWFPGLILLWEIAFYNFLLAVYQKVGQWFIREQLLFCCNLWIRIWKNSKLFNKV